MRVKVNAEGYRDPTYFSAIENIERERRRKMRRDRKKKRKGVDHERV
ncbi:MAG: hypothetical protein U0K57_07725 [Lachnospiraceae bacterium]|nr:hypothetical protein [Lachnospiraceae bacterium]